MLPWRPDYRPQLVGTSHEQAAYRLRLPFWPIIVMDVDNGSRSSLYCGSVGPSQREEVAMLWTIFVILLVLWLLGVVTSYSLGGFIHVLLVIAVILAVMQLIQGRRAL